MADIICRWRNGTPQTVVELVNSMPHKVMPSSDFRIYMTQNWNGDFFRTPYQLACQLGLYCEAEDGMFYLVLITSNDWLNPQYSYPLTDKMLVGHTFAKQSYVKCPKRDRHT